MSNDWDVEQDELLQYGADPMLCDRCRMSVSGRCAFHRSLERIGITASNFDPHGPLTEEQMNAIRKDRER